MEQMLRRRWIGGEEGAKETDNTRPILCVGFWAQKCRLVLPAGLGVGERGRERVCKGRAHRHRAPARVVVLLVGGVVGGVGGDIGICVGNGISTAVSLRRMRRAAGLSSALGAAAAAAAAAAAGSLLPETPVARSEAGA